MFEANVSLPRSAFSPRETARAGDVWRAFQDVAVWGSVASGWPPQRYRDEGVSFIVRAMIALHHRETIYGEPLVGRTWPSRFRRGMFFRRECRILGAAAEPVASATQDWVHVRADLSLARASEALVESFPPEDHESPIEMPEHEAIEGARAFRFELTCWHTWADPLGHVNHPAYVDWADEATSRAMVQHGMDPVGLRPIAESAHYATGVSPEERIAVSTRLIGRTADGAAVFNHRVSAAERSAARLVTVRALVGEEGPSALLELC